MRQHGLQAPLDPHQLASWIIFFALVSGVYAFYVPFVEDAGARWALVAVYSVLVVAIVALDLYTSSLDPSDPGLKGATDGEFFCGLCQASVARTSKHCRACDRCVEGFDHHCKWLNNCVGARNYWHFFGLISSTVSLLVLQLGWGLWLFIRSFTQDDEMRALVADKYGNSVVYAGWQAALGIYMGLLITSVVMLGELLFFHIVLVTKGMTTYDYIIAQRDAKLAAPPPRSGNNLKACRSGRVADATTAKRRVKVGLNPCAAMRTNKPAKPSGNSGTPWDAGKRPAPLPATGAPGAASSSSMPSPGSKPESSDSKAVAGKDRLSGLTSGLSGLGDKPGGGGAGGGGGSMQEVARAVAEQTMLGHATLREAALLRGGALPGGPAAAPFGTSSGCVPECSTTASGGGAGPAGGKDFTPLVHRGAAHAGTRGQPLGPGHPVPTAPAHPQHRLATAVGSPGAGTAGRGPGPGSASGAGARVASPTGFDAAAAAAAGTSPKGRHLGGISASPSGLSSRGSGSGSGAMPTSPVPSSLSRPNSLPPLRTIPSVPAGLTQQGSGPLYPSKLPLGAGAGNGARRGDHLAAAPE